MVWGQRGSIKQTGKPSSALGVGKETEYETSAMSGGWPTVAKDLVPTLPRGIMQLPANGSSRILASKQRKVNIDLWAYADSHMGDATSGPCCYSCTHDT